MIELVPMAYRIVNEVDLDAGTGSMAKDEGSVSANGKSKSQGGIGGETRSGEGRTSSGEVNGAAKKMDEDEERDAVFFRLEMLGYRVGQGLVERYVEPFIGEFWLWSR